MGVSQDIRYLVGLLWSVCKGIQGCYLRRDSLSKMPQVLVCPLSPKRQVQMDYRSLRARSSRNGSSSSGHAVLASSHLAGGLAPLPSPRVLAVTCAGAEQCAGRWGSDSLLLFTQPYRSAPLSAALCSLLPRKRLLLRVFCP